MRWLAIAALLAVLGCLEDPDLDGTPFPCRAPEDCIEGFVCDPDRWVCLPEGETSPVDAGTLDAGE